MPQTIATYLRRIRNDRKRNYGYALWHSIANGAEPPDRPDNLSYMAVQAVSMDLRKYDPQTGQLT